MSICVMAALECLGVLAFIPESTAPQVDLLHLSMHIPDGGNRNVLLLSNHSELDNPLHILKSSMLTLIRC